MVRQQSAVVEVAFFLGGQVAQEKSKKYHYLKNWYLSKSMIYSLAYLYVHFFCSRLFCCSFGGGEK